MKKAKLPVGEALCLLAALIWGLAFSAQDAASEHIPAFTCNSLRSYVGGLVLIPVILLFDRLRGNGRRLFSRRNRHFVDLSADELKGGALCGLCLSAASAVQQLGCDYGAEAGKAAFLTALYVVLVPVAGLLFRRRVGWQIWCAVGMTVVGIFLLSVNPATFSVAKADWIILLCALLFTCHILCIDHFSSRVDGVRLACVQFFVAALVCTPLMVFEQPSGGEILAAALPVLYLGVMSSGVAYTAQVLGQQHTSPTVASILLSLESVFGVLFGALIGGERMTPREIIGCVIVFAAILLSQIPLSARKHPPAQTGEKSE